VLLLLVRHGTTDLTRERLVGRTPDIHLNPAGQEQARGVVERLRGVPVDAVYSSPLERALETATPLAEDRGLDVAPEAGLLEVDYGEWTNRPFKELRRTDLWKRVQQRPADARFPGGEAMREAQDRAVGAVERLAHAHPAGSVAAFSHADVIKAVVAHLLGQHLDMFQRLHVAPGSITALQVGTGPPGLLFLNVTGKLSDQLPRRRRTVRQN
jgi:probable phosphoglycerate mutase